MKSYLTGRQQSVFVDGYPHYLWSTTRKHPTTQPSPCWHECGGTVYIAGDNNDYWKANHYSYQNSLSRIKMNGQLSRPIKETLGVKQGNIKSSDHYTVYNGPVLDTLDGATLGVWIGPINTGVTGVADDDFLMSDDPVKLQGLW